MGGASVDTLARRMLYGGRKGRSARKRLRKMCLRVFDFVKIGEQFSDEVRTGLSALWNSPVRLG